MNENSALEGRIGRLFDAYANQADIEVDPLATARLAAAAEHTQRVFRLTFNPARTGLAFAALVIAVLTAIGGALLAGAAIHEREPVAIPGGRVGPFLGLPPSGAAVSTPERGDLELTFGGRILDRGFDRVWMYGDGRFIWLWENPRPSPVMERRLTPEGVALLRSELLESARPTDILDPSRPSAGNHAGVLWGWASVRLGDRVVPLDWTDAGLPRRLVDPQSWLPATAWEDPRSFGYVPASYAVCLWPDAESQTLDRLPSTATGILLADGRPVPHLPGTATPMPECYVVTLQRAREIDAALTEAGLPRRVSHAISFNIRDGHGPDIELRILPMTPDGEVICECG